MTEEALFVEALEITDAQTRDKFLDTHCSGQPKRRARLARLLETHSQAGRFLETPAQADVMPLPTFQALEPGSLIDRYRVLRLLGEGGMGSVYLAEQTEPVRRQVALKVIKTGLESPQVMLRFSMERQALAVMDHPNIAKVLDGGTTPGGQPYFVMELVQGAPIIEFCDTQHLSLESRLELFITVCQAVQHAHQKGLIHRDLKPGNILVAEQEGKPVPKIIDFGVAKAMDHSLPDQSYYSMWGMLVGTLEYMSPEQASLNVADIDTRTDVYSLGVILYELLTGTTPLQKSRLKQAPFDEALRIIREVEPPRPSARLSSLHNTSIAISAPRQIESRHMTRKIRGELDWIVMKALEKDRNRRYETASSLAADAQRYLNDESVLACPPSAMYRLGKTVRRHRGAVLAVSLILLALVTGVIAATWGLLRATDAETIALAEVDLKKAALGEKETALATAQQRERDAKEQLFQSLLNQARARRFSRQMGQRIDSLDAVMRASKIRFDERLRDEAIAALALPDIRPGPVWNALPVGFSFWTFDDNYQTYARASDDGTINIRTVADNREIRNIRSTPAKLMLLRLSPDGTHIAKVDSSFRFQLWRVSDGQEVLPGPLEHITRMTFSSDNRSLVLSTKGSVLRFDLATGLELNRWNLPDKAQPHTMDFHPDCRRLAIGYEKYSEVSIYDSTKGTLITSLPVGELSQQVVAWHPDGVRLAVGQYRFIQLWDVETQRQLTTLEGHVQQIESISFHPNGKLLVSTSWDGVMRLWDLSTRQTLMQVPVLPYLQFSRNGRWIGAVLRDSEAHLLEVISGNEYRTLFSESGGVPGNYTNTDISPDGNLLAVNMGESGVHVWHVKDSRQMGVLPTGLPLFHPNGSDILIANKAGLQRYPLSLLDGSHVNGKVFEPEQEPVASRTLALPRKPICLYRAWNTSTVSMVNEGQGLAWIVDLETESVRSRILEHKKASYVALSSDGKWMAASGWHSEQVSLWNLKTGEMVQTWPLFRATVFFTPDSRTLVIGQGGDFSFHEVETRKLHYRLRRDVALYPGYVAFSPSSNLMALEMEPGIVHLKEVSTGKTVAQLEDPHGDRASWMGFTPDGSQLVVVAHYAKAIHVWDLRALRQRLKAMKLDWNWPEFK